MAPGNISKLPATILFKSLTVSVLKHTQCGSLISTQPNTTSYPSFAGTLPKWALGENNSLSYPMWTHATPPPHCWYNQCYFLCYFFSYYFYYMICLRSFTHIYTIYVVRVAINDYLFIYLFNRMLCRYFFNWIPLRRKIFIASNLCRYVIHILPKTSMTQ